MPPPKSKKRNNKDSTSTTSPTNSIVDPTASTQVKEATNMQTTTTAATVADASNANINGNGSNNVKSSAPEMIRLNWEAEQQKQGSPSKQHTLSSSPPADWEMMATTTPSSSTTSTQAAASGPTLILEPGFQQDGEKQPQPEHWPPQVAQRVWDLPLLGRAAASLASAYDTYGRQSRFDTVKRAVNAIESTTDDLLKQAAPLVERSPALTAAISRVDELACNGLAKLDDSCARVIERKDAVKETVQRVGKSTAETAQAMLPEAVVSLVADNVGKAQEKLHDTVDKVNAIKSTTVDRVNAMKTKAQDTIHDTVDRVNTLKTSTVDRVNTLKTSTVDRVNTLKTSTVDRVNTLKTNTVSAIKTKAHDAMETAQSVLPPTVVALVSSNAARAQQTMAATVERVRAVKSGAVDRVAAVKDSVQSSIGNVEHRMASVATSVLAAADHKLDQLLPPASYAEAAATGTTVDTAVTEKKEEDTADPAVANIPRSPSSLQQQQQPLGSETRKLLSQVRAVSTKARHRVTARASDRLQNIKTRSVEAVYALRALTINLLQYAHVLSQTETANDDDDVSNNNNNNNSKQPKQQKSLLARSILLPWTVAAAAISIAQGALATVLNASTSARERVEDAAHSTKGWAADLREMAAHNMDLAWGVAAAVKDSALATVDTTRKQGLAKGYESAKASLGEGAVWLQHTACQLPFGRSLLSLVGLAPRPEEA